MVHFISNFMDLPSGKNHYPHWIWTSGQSSLPGTVLEEFIDDITPLCLPVQSFISCEFCLLGCSVSVFHIQKLGLNFRQKEEKCWRSQVLPFLKFYHLIYKVLHYTKSFITTALVRILSCGYHYLLENVDKWIYAAHCYPKQNLGPCE